MVRERRSHKLINTPLQIRVGLEIILHSFLLVAMICLLLFSPPFVTMFSSYSVEDHQAIAKELFLLNASKWPLFLLLAVFIGIVSILFSHHIAGPMYHVGKMARELQQRNMAARFKFRKWDYMNELESDLNQLIGRWREDVRSLSEIYEKASQSSKAGNMAEVQKQLASMEAIVKSYKNLE